MYKFDLDKSIARFSELLIYETVAGNNDEFRKFKNAIKVIYPNIARVCEFELIGDLGLTYRFKGKDSGKSVVLMAHYDVVPAASDIRWDWHPFSGEIVDNEIWGRGAVDTKCTLCSVMEAVESLIEQGFTPDYDVYMCFGGDEETSGNSAIAIAAELKKRGVRPFLILDEGGAVLDASSVGMGERAALIGIAEKGYMDVEFIARGKGGHTSLPVRDNPLVTIAEVVRRLEKPFKPVISEPFRIMRDAAAKHAKLKLRIALKSRIIQKIFMPKLMRMVPEIAALTQTTGAVTLISGGSAANVVPEEVRAVGNFRIISESSVAETLEIIKKKLIGLDIEVNVLESLEPSKISKIEGDGWEMLNESIAEIWGNECAVIPYLMIARSDSRAYSDISDSIYRFSPMLMSQVERHSIHGMNERISISSFAKMIEFYLRLITGGKQA
jgi:carboxypeptidase PM20D1